MSSHVIFKMLNTQFLASQEFQLLTQIKQQVPFIQKEQEIS